MLYGVRVTSTGEVFNIFLGSCSRQCMLLSGAQTSRSCLSFLSPCMQVSVCGLGFAEFYCPQSHPFKACVWVVPWETIWCRIHLPGKHISLQSHTQQMTKPSTSSGPVMKSIKTTNMSRRWNSSTSALSRISAAMVQAMHSNVCDRFHRDASSECFKRQCKKIIRS